MTNGISSNPQHAAALRARNVRFAVAAVVLTLCFCKPLWGLFRFAMHDDFFSYIPLVPLITGYLIWIKRKELPRPDEPALVAASVFSLGGVFMLWFARRVSANIHQHDVLTFLTAAYLCFVLAAVLGCYGAKFSRNIWFPLFLLIFAIPIPTHLLDIIESFFQETSAATAAAFIWLTGMPVMRDGTYLQLPGFALVVAPECSGIHSTMVLLITSLLAGYLFLQTAWRRWLLVLIVVPLAIARNGFRVFVIGQLCVRISHDMIDSPIHHQGGPIFFALSLIPFFALLLWLRKTELRASKRISTPAIAPNL